MNTQPTFLQQSLHKMRWSSGSLTSGRIQLGMSAGPDKWTRVPSGQSRDREAPDTLSVSALTVRSFASRGRLRNLLAECCTLCLYYVTINTAINLQMFTTSYGRRRFAARNQGSHCEFFPSIWAVCLGLIMKNRVKYVFFEVINSSPTSMCSIK